MSDRGLDRRQVVRQGGDPPDDDATAGQLSGEIAGVGVAGLADRELGPDGQELCGEEVWHRKRVSPEGLCNTRR
jgi:hypothetical protein